MINLPGERRDIKRVRPSADVTDSDILVAITKYFTSGSDIFRVKRMERPDDTLTIYDYTFGTGGFRINLVDSCQPNTGKTSINDGARSITVFGPLGETISTSEIDISSTILLASNTFTIPRHLLLAEVS